MVVQNHYKKINLWDSKCSWVEWEKKNLFQVGMCETQLSRSYPEKISQILLHSLLLNTTTMTMLVLHRKQTPQSIKIIIIGNASMNQFDNAPLTKLEKTICWKIILKKKLSHKEVIKQHNHFKTVNSLRSLIVKSNYLMLRSEP